MDNTHYSNTQQQVEWLGLGFDSVEQFSEFMTKDVKPKVNDEEFMDELQKELSALAQTDFASQTLTNILQADPPEVRGWAIGESIAECLLEKKFDAIWPWNNSRDKRTPFASLPGADLVGFVKVLGKTKLALGEVKSSSDKNMPPNVLYGKSGMIHQIDSLCNNLTDLVQLIKWLFARTKSSEYKSHFQEAMSLYLASGRKEIVIFGVLVRDTIPDELDFKSRAEAISPSVEPPTMMKLIACYIPCPIEDLSGLIHGDIQK